MAFSLPGAQGAPKFDDVFTIPEAQGDTFVLKLSQSVGADRIQNTLDSYVVTDSIRANLKQALGYVRTALDTGGNQGTYLNGSFGSGKSHFMAVLYAMLANYPPAREVPELQELIAANEDLVQKKYLQLTFHFLGSTTIEGTVFGSYLKQMRDLHPDVTPPMLHADAELFQDAENLREAMGDEAFFTALNKGATSAGAGAGQGGAGAAAAPAKRSGGFDLGSFAARATGGAVRTESQTWDATSFEEAITAQDLAARQRLATALSSTLFSSHRVGSNWVGLSEGLKRITDHAKGLGYDAVVLYLDELILWLMFMTPSSEQFLREAQKLTLFVENDLGQLAIPVVSFIARQKNLAAWAASTEAAGSDQSVRKQAFSHQEGRFNTIELGNKNLPEIANKRLLQPKSVPAAQQIETAFSELKLKPEVLQVLLNGENLDGETSAATMEQFRLTYPFSPALVDTLINLSSVMQRERTALKVMENLLIDQRSTGSIGTVIPVGDAFDYLVAGSDSTNDSASKRFNDGREFWVTRMRPTILAAYGRSPETPDSDLNRAELADIRLGKTLMLSALAPNVASLKNLTARRLANLNHGTMATLFGSDTVGQVLSTVQRWATELPEIQIEKNSTDPTITLVLDDVPWREVLDSARSHDTPAKRTERVREALKDAFRVEGQQEYDQAYRTTITWRGTQRLVEVIFGNVRDPHSLPEDAFKPLGADTLRVVVDYPFDETGHTVAEDHQRMEKLRSDGSGERFTIVWLPQFFDYAQLQKLGDLVVTDYVITPAGLADHTQRIPHDKVSQVEATLRSYRDTLAEELDHQICVSYGVHRGAEFLAGQAPIKSLDPSILLDRPVGTTMREAVERLLSEAFSQRYPDHPDFGIAQVIRTAEFDRALALLREAALSHNGRADIDKDHRRNLRSILLPLKLAEVYDAHISFTKDTASATMSDIDAQLRRKGFAVEGEVSVQSLQEAVQAAYPTRGLTDDVVSLYVGAWAALRNRSWYQDGKPMPQPPTIKHMDRRILLRPVQLPEQDQWLAALTLFEKLSGVSHPKHLTGTNLSAFATAVNEFVGSYRDRIQGLATELNQLATKLGVGSDSPRVTLTDRLNETFEALYRQRANALGMVEYLADTAARGQQHWGATQQQVITALEAVDTVRHEVQKLIGSGVLASQCDRILEHAESDRNAELIVQQLADGLSAHEFTIPIEKTMRVFKESSDEWIKRSLKVPVSPEPAPPVTPEPAPPVTPGEPVIGPPSTRPVPPTAQTQPTRPVRTFEVAASDEVDDTLRDVGEVLRRHPGRYRITMELLTGEEQG